MCACVEVNGLELGPGDKIEVWLDEERAERIRWSGFARAEILDWWRRHGARLVDVPVERFAVRSSVSGELVWADVPAGRVIRGLVERRGDGPLLRLVTRPAAPLELLHCQHERMPKVDAPLFTAEAAPTSGLPLFDIDLAHAEASGRAVQELLF